MIVDATNKDYDALIYLWEMSVRASHDFLSEQDIQAIKTQMMEQYFDAVQLKCCINESSERLGFCGISGEKLEMLFVLPTAQGQGIGSELCRYVIAHHGIKQVDVNEQNSRTVVFYEKMGFIKTGRSDTDGMGNPFPLIHMKLTTS